MNNFFVLASQLFLLLFSVYLHIGAFAPAYQLGIFVDTHDVMGVARRARAV
jgi:hypothetical protein